MVSGADVPSRRLLCFMSFNFVLFSWFFGDLPKEDVEEMLLMPQNGIGSFLVSENGRLPGELTLSMRCTSRTSSIKVL